MQETYYAVRSRDHMPVLQCWTRHVFPDEPPRPPQCYASLRIVRISGGSATWQIGAETFRAELGDLFLFNNREPRSVAKVEPGAPLVLEAIEFLPLSIYPNQGVLPIFFGATHSRRLPAGTAAGALEAFEEVWREASEARPFREEMARAALMRLTALLARACPQGAQNDFDAGDYRRICEAVAYLHRHLEEPLKESDLARRAGMSVSAFSRAFRQYNGITLAAYLRRCRVRLALERIQAGDCNVLDAALQSGFCSSSGFYKAVQEVTGAPPRRKRP